MGVDLTSTIKFAAGVDREDGIIYDCILCEVGQPSGHTYAGYPYYINIEFLQEAARDMMGQKVPVMFTHSAGLGRQAGSVKDIRLEGRKLKGDLYLLNSANMSPELPGMKDYILELAEEDATAINFSIYADLAGFYQKVRASDGTTQKRFVFTLDEGGNYIAPDPKKGKIYAEYKKLNRADLVHKGALTSKLFQTMETNELKQKLGDLMAEAGFFPMLEANISEFDGLKSFFASKEKKGLIAQVRSLVGADGTAEELLAAKNDLEAAEGKLLELSGELTAAQALANAKAAELADITEKLEAMTGERDALAARVAELEAEPTPGADLISDPAPSGSRGGAKSREELILSDSTTQKALAMFGEGK